MGPKEISQQIPIQAELGTYRRGFTPNPQTSYGEQSGILQNDILCRRNLGHEGKIGERRQKDSGQKIAFKPLSFQKYFKKGWNRQDHSNVSSLRS